MTAEPIPEWQVHIWFKHREFPLIISNLLPKTAVYIRVQIAAKNASYAYFSVGGTDYSVNRENVDYVTVSRMQR